MNVELVRAVTEDKIQLDGALHAGATDKPLVVCLHGVGGNFYGGTMFSELLPPLQARDHSVLWANTRGHDSITFSGSPGPALGAAFEMVDHCRIDFAAWAEWAASRGFPSLILLGHSLGAIKAVYCQSVQPLPSIQSIIAASPPRLSYLAFKNGPRSSAFFEDMQIANQLIADGKGDQLFRPRRPSGSSTGTHLPRISGSSGSRPGRT